MLKNIKVLRSSADLVQLCDTEFQTEGALTLKACADNASAILGNKSNNLLDDRIMCVLVDGRG